MPRTNVQSKSAYGGKIGFSRAVRIGNLIAVSGTAPVGADGNAAFVGDPYAQTRHCIEIIKEAIEEAGGTLNDVIRTRVYLTDISRWPEAAKAHTEYFQEIRPASTFIEVKSLIDPDWMVEMEADCVVENI